MKRIMMTGEMESANETRMNLSEYMWSGMEQQQLKYVGLQVVALFHSPQVRIADTLRARVCSWE